MVKELGVYNNRMEFKLQLNGDLIELLGYDHDTEEWVVVDYYHGNTLCAKLAEELKEDICVVNVADQKSSATYSKTNGIAGVQHVARR